MIRVECVQGETAWLEARAGIVTASEADSILTPKQRKPAKADAYFARLVAERLIGRAIQTDSTAAMDRGHDNEPEARRWFAFTHDVEIEEVGFLKADDGSVGASPDALVGDDAGLEIKSNLVVAHVATLLDPDAFVEKHYGQCQVGMLVTGRPEWWLCSFNPELPKVARRIPRDESYIAAFRAALAVFNARLAEAVERITAADPRYVTLDSGERVRNPLA